MKGMRLSVLAAAVLATVSVSAQADFLNDSSLDIKLRNVHFDVKTDTPGKNWSQWAQGVQVNFKSGYISDAIGFDASYYGALKLDHTGKDPFSSTMDGGQLLTKDYKSYHKFGQAYLKAKLGDEQQGFYGQAGYMSGQKGLILGSGSRSTPSSYRGAHGEVYVQDFTVYGTYVDRISMRTENSWDEFKTKSGDTIKHAWQVGTLYQANNVDAEVVHLQSKDFHEQSMLNLGYTFDLAENTSLIVSGNYHYAKGSGDTWKNNQANNAFDDKASHLNLNTELKLGGLGLKLSYGTTDAEKKGGLGYLKYTYCDNEYGASPSAVSRYWSDFMFDGEKVLQVQGSYDFADLNVPGLNVSLTYTDGSDIKDQSSNKMTGENETDLIVSYAVQEGTFKGVSFRAIKAWHTEKFDNKKDVDSEHLRVYLDYTIGVF